MGLKIFKEQKERHQKIEYEDNKKQQDKIQEIAKNKRNEEAFYKAVKDQDKNKLFNQILNYKNELNSYIDYIGKYKERQKNKKEDISKLDRFGKNKYLLKEIFIEGLYIWQISILLIIYSFIDIYGSIEDILGAFLVFLIIGFLVIFYKKSENKKSAKQDIGLFKSLGIFIGLLLYINHIKIFGFIIPGVNFVLFDMFFLIILPIIGSFNFNSLNSKPSFIEKERLKKLIEKDFEGDEKINEAYEMTNYIDNYEDNIKKLLENTLLKDFFLIKNDIKRIKEISSELLNNGELITEKELKINNIGKDKEDIDFILLKYKILSIYFNINTKEKINNEEIENFYIHYNKYKKIMENSKKGLKLEKDELYLEIEQNIGIILDFLESDEVITDKVQDELMTKKIRKEFDIIHQKYNKGEIILYQLNNFISENKKAFKYFNIKFNSII